MSDDVKARWYVLQAMSGQEMRATKALQARCQMDRAKGIDNGVEEVVIPTERVEDRRNGRKTVHERKLYPGYVLVKARLYKEDGHRDADVWDFIKNTEGVIGFIGGEKPVALAQNDVDLMISQQGEDVEKPKPKISYNVGESVIIKDGAFENLEGVVEDVDQERMKLKLSVSIFGRPTPVELEFWQVERP